ncbi:hypothetical protein CY34DRAFT_399048 [Suillus luteus UH-Slu-Lm8-n1]|uniref:Uncharacterized protein n=1 Tax=Suillus luteus UH-Slu-Lm8-n1 TaxID=930992 RepID=A0A0C9ZLD5_9AGAM|nr:hypothetical protein CY34DRAFT_399048 [Suillus luteus UH-Slu-Lm8-n1]
MIHNRVSHLHLSLLHAFECPSRSFVFFRPYLRGRRFVVFIVDGCWEELYRRC